MATKKVQTLNANNAKILAGVWNDASSEYQKRIPLADQGQIAKTMAALDQYPDMWNELVTALVNRIGLVVMQSRTWSNPLKYLKKGMMEYGETIEEITTNLIQAQRYDVNECYEDVFKCSPVETATAFHSINRQDMYPLTVNEMALRRAFTTEYGLQEYITQLMNAPYVSDEYDEYLIMRNLFKLYDQDYGYFKVQIPEISNPLDDAEVSGQAKAIAAAVDEYKYLFDFMSTKYNGLGWPTSTRGYDIIVFATPRLAAVLDTYVLPFAFRETNAINLRIIPIDDFGIDGVQAIMCDERHIMCYDTYMQFASIQNPKGRSWNYWWHHDGIYSLSKFVNCIAFTTAAPSPVPVTPTYTITEVTPAIAEGQPAFASKGGKINMAATVTGTIDPEGAEGAEVPQAVMWSIDRATEIPLGQRTFIDSEGTLFIDENELNTALTIKATSPYRAVGANPVSGTVVVGVGAVAEATESTEG